MIVGVIFVRPVFSFGLIFACCAGVALCAAGYRKFAVFLIFPPLLLSCPGVASLWTPAHMFLIWRVSNSFMPLSKISVS